MGESVDNLVLEQLRLIREKLGQVEGMIGELAEKIDDLKLGQEGQTGILIGLGQYIHSIDTRVEHLEQKMGA